MDRLPNADRATISPAKLAGYVLSSAHRRGRHKARVFAAAFGLTLDDARVLEDALYQAARDESAELVRNDAHGAHYAVEFRMEFNGRAGRVRSLDDPARRGFSPLCVGLVVK